MSIKNLIPAKYRKAIYTALATAYATEAALDLVGWGLVPDTVQGKFVIVAGALGFTLAAGNTSVNS